MTKAVLNGLVNLENTSAVTTINANNAVIETAFDNTLSRDGTFPNQMEAELDMNSHPIINLPTPVSNYEPIRLIDVNTINGSGITVSPLPTGGSSGQVLTKNSSTNFDTSWVTPTISIVTPEQFGYTTYGIGDAGPAIQAALDSVPSGSGVVVDLGSNHYKVATPFVVSKDFAWIRGQGQSTLLDYAPTTGGTTMITWHNPAVTSGIYSGRLSDMQIISVDTTHTKTAINLIDVGEMEVSQIYIPVWSDVSFNSIGLKTNGRECSSFHDLKIFADIPIFVDKNPNSLLSTDHFHFWNIYVIPADIQPCITVGNVIITNMTFDGYQAWVGGLHGLFYQATSPGGVGFNLSFSNVRIEEPKNPAGSNFFINAPSFISGVTFKNCKMDEGRLGLFARGALNLSVEEVYYPVVSPASKAAFDVDTSCQSVLIKNCRWESGCTQNLGGLSSVYSYTTPSFSPIPTNALYSI